MQYETIKTQFKDNVVTVELNRPEVHNALNEKLIKELTDCFKKLSKDDSIRCIILTGKGSSFCAGADLNWMKSMVDYSMDENIMDSNLLLDLFDTIYTCPKPVIGRINGHAFGGGVGLIAVCDITFAPPGIKFGFTEVKLGIIPAVISTFVVKRIGLFTMKRLFITGERFTSEYSKYINLIDFIVPEEKLDDEIEKYVTILNSSGPKAINEIKDIINKIEDMNVTDYKKYTVKKIAELRVSDEGQEGINAFLEKRKTKWSG